MRYRFDIAPKTRQVEIPPMAIQTLVENAIRHGIAQHPEGGEISIQTTLQQPVMVVCIVNTGQIKNNATNDGIGLQNTRERLRLLFGNTAQLTVENISQNQVCAQVSGTAHWTTNMNALIVDDSRLARQELKHLLKAFGDYHCSR